MDAAQKRLLARGIRRAYQVALVTPPFYKGSVTDKLIDTMLAWDVDFSGVNLDQFKTIREED